MAERAVAIKLTVKDQELVLAALRSVGKEGEAAAKRLEAANVNTARSSAAAVAANTALDASAKKTTANLGQMRGGHGLFDLL